MNSSQEANSSGAAARSSISTSRSLLERIRSDDPVAWSRLVDLYAPLVLRWCRRSNLPDQEIADIFQDVFQAVATHIAGFRKEKSGDTFRGWLRTITQNKVRDYYRRLNREPAGAGGTDAQIRFSNLPADLTRDLDDSAEERAGRGLCGRALELIRGEFEERTWRAFWLTAVDGRAPREIAIELEMSPGAVRVAKCRVLRRLREELGESS
jgi:RNA polymerase sigma-70 factor (ECF subfamily)